MERRWLTGGALGVIGLSLAAVQIAHAVQQTDVPIAIAVDAVPFVAMGLGVAFAGVWLGRDAAFEETATRVALWSVGGMLALASVSALVLFSQQVTTGTLARAAYLTMDLITVGALGGALVGTYDARSRHRRLQLAAERDRIETFAEKAADVNNFGRAIYGAYSVDGVAAYVLQAVEGLVGLRESAVLRVTNDDVDAIADATRSLDAVTSADLARDARSQAARDVVVTEAVASESLPDEVATVVTALLHEDADGAIVVVAISNEGSGIPETDRQLLELVVSHAAATLGRLADSPGEPVAR